MSVLKPVAKNPRISVNPALQNKTVALNEQEMTQFLTEEEKNRRIAGHPSVGATAAASSSKEKATPHPRGHKPKMIDEIWKTMDSNAFLHLTDSATMLEVWVQPLFCVPERGAFTTVTFKEMIAGRHIKYREASCKMSVVDLMKMLYLNDCLQADMQGVPRTPYDEWVKEKSAACMRAKGLEDVNAPAKLCNFILTEDRDFGFYPAFLKGRCGMFFRKIGYHTYKSGRKGDAKIENPSMVKCKATKGDFEYIIEGRVFPLPDEWFDSLASGQDDANATLELAESQAI